LTVKPNDEEEEKWKDGREGGKRGERNKEGGRLLEEGRWWLSLALSLRIDGRTKSKKEPWEKPRFARFDKSY